jgi:hypothetical protein
MKTANFARAATAALIGLAIAGSKTAFADIKDFEFQLAKPTFRSATTRCSPFDC